VTAVDLVDAELQCRFHRALPAVVPGSGQS